MSPPPQLHCLRSLFPTGYEQCGFRRPPPAAIDSLVTFSATHKGVLPLNPTEAQLVAAYGAMEAQLIRYAPTPPSLQEGS